MFRCGALWRVPRGQNQVWKLANCSHFQEFYRKAKSQRKIKSFGRSCCYLSYPQNWSCYSYLAKMTEQKSAPVRIICWIPKNEIRLISFVPIVWEKGGHQYYLSKVCFKVALQHLIKQFGEKKVWQVLRFTFTPFFCDDVKTTFFRCSTFFNLKELE